MRCVDNGARSRRLEAMQESSLEFQRIVTALLTRFCEQGSAPANGAQVALFARQLATVLHERGLPRPLRPDELGVPGGMSDAELAPLVERVVEGIDHSVLAEAARQLAKACFYPEFRVCRDSFREVTRDGACRRQQIDRVRARISGSHCVDCPHFVALEPAQHEALLRAAWRGDAAEFDAHREMFLPEDFRALRRWRHAAARCESNDEI